MKKFSIFAAAALMLAAVSCNKEAAPIAEPEQGAPAVQKITFTAYADNGTDTRTILNGNDIKWAAGETIYVFDGTAPRAFTSTNTEEDAIVTFEGEAAVASTYTAVSPAATMTGNTINATIPVFQTATANSFDPKANVSVAVANGGPDVDLTNLTLQFKNAGAVVRFKLTDADVAKVRLDAIGGEKLAGKASITLDSDNLPTVAMASDAESCVILKPADGNFAANTTYAIAIAPGTYSQGFKLTLFKADGKFKSFSNKNSQTLGRNKMMDFGTIPAVSKWKDGPKSYQDVITRETTGVSDGSGYSTWNGKSSSATTKSTAIYAGTTAGANNSVQMRSSGNSGIVTTTSGGNLSKITIDWNSNTTTNRSILIYGSKTAYTSAEDLYGSNPGTLLGELSIDNGETTLNISGNYQYVGIRSKSSALYLNFIKIDWTQGASDMPIDPSIPAETFVIENPDSFEIPTSGGSKSFVIESTVPWTIKLADESTASYTLNTSGNRTTVNVTMGELASGSRDAVFTITPSVGTPKVLTFSQAFVTSFVLEADDVPATSGNGYVSSVDEITASDGSKWFITGYIKSATGDSAEYIQLGKGGANYLKTPASDSNIKKITVNYSGNNSYYLAVQTTEGVELLSVKNPATPTDMVFDFVANNITAKQVRLVGRRNSGTSNAAANIRRVTVEY